MADLGNTSVFSQTDANNNTGTNPGFPEGMPPSRLNDANRALQGAVFREWNWRNFTATTTGSANAYVVTYTVAPAALYTGQRFAVITNFAVTGSATVNINGLGAKTIKKDVAGTLTALSSGDMGSGQYVELTYNGTDMVWTNWQGAATAVPTAASTTETLTGTDTAKFVTADSLAALWEKGSDVASAGTTAFGEGGYAHVTGTTTITDIDFSTAKNGRGIVVVFDGILTLTHHATTLVLPTGANITTAAGDTACFIQDNADNIKCVWYQRANGQALAVASTGPTFVNKTTTQTSTTTTFANDNALAFAVSANKKYSFRVYLLLESPAAADFKFQFTGPASPTSVRYSTASGSTSVLATAFSTSVSLNSSSSGEMYVISGYVSNGANAGTVTLQWAQLSASGTTTVYDGSVLEWIEVA